jgi:replicative DNA helicase
MNCTKEDTQASLNNSYEFCDYNNERLLLSLAIKNEDNFYSLLARVKDDNFLAPDTKNLFLLLKAMHNSGMRKFDIPVMLKVANEMELYKMCTIEFLEALENSGASDDNFELYLSKLLDDSVKFKLYLGLVENSDLVYTNAKSLQSISGDDLLSKVQADFITLSMNNNAVAEPVHIGEGLDEYIESIKDQKVDIMGVRTGYPIFDAAIDGLIPGTLTIIAARKKMGKSTLLTNIAVNVAVRNDGSVLYVDTEMSFVEWRARVLAIMSGIDERIIKHGGFKNDKFVLSRVLDAVKCLKSSKLFHFYLPGYTVDKISALYKKYSLKEKITLGIFDYIKEPDMSSVEKGRKEHQILGDVTTKLKDLAGKLDIPFLAAVQLNRSGDVADSDRVARYGDVVAFWGLRDLKEAEENAWDLDRHGYYALHIKDSRRGGRTGEAGIGYKFWHSKLTISEIAAPDQIDHGHNENDRIDTGSYTNSAEGAS